MTTEWRHLKWWHVVRVVAPMIVALAGLALTFHVTVNKTQVTQRQVASTVVLKHGRPAGVVRETQCYGIRKGTSESDVLATFGMPSNPDAYDRGWNIAYPLKEDQSRTCTVWFGLESDKVEQVDMDLPIK